MLQQEHGVRVEQVQLTLAAPGVLPPDVQPAVRSLGRVVRVRSAVPGGHLGGEHVQPDAAEPGRGAGEVLVHEVLGQPQRLGHLRAGVRRDRADAHLGHHLQHALAERLDVLADRVDRVLHRQGTGADHVLDRLEGEVRIDGGGAVPEQQGDVVHLAAVARLHHQADLRPGALPHQVRVHGCGEQERRDGRAPAVAAAVGEHHDPGAGLDGGAHLGADPVQGRGQCRAAAVHFVQSGHHGGGQAGQVAVVVDVHDPGQLVVVDDREGQLDLPAGGRGRVQQVLLGAHRAAQRGDQLLADRVQRRVGHLREQLAEVVVEQPRPLGQHGHRRVGAHRPDWLGAGDGHRRQQHPQLLLGVAEGLLAPDEVGAVVVVGAPAGRQRVQPQDAGVQPVCVRQLGSELALDLVVGDHPPGLGVDQEHPARL